MGYSFSDFANDRDIKHIFHKVEQVTVYHNSDVKEFHEDILAYLTAGKVDWVTLTSSANVRRFMSMLPGNFPADVFQELKFASLSQITTQAAREVGIEPTVEAQNYHFAGLIQAILQHSLNEKD